METLQVTDEVRKTLALRPINFYSGINDTLFNDEFHCTRLLFFKEFQLNELYEVFLHRKLTGQMVSIGVARLVKIQKLKKTDDFQFCKYYFKYLSANEVYQLIENCQ